MIKTGIFALIALMCGLAASCLAEANDSGATNVGLHGFIAFENGQIVKGIGSKKINDDIDHGWLERVLVQASHEFVVSERLKFNLAVEGQFAFSYPQSIGARESMLARYWMYPARVDALYSWGDPKKPWLECQFGYFPYRYNQRVTNLGEFLFRSGTYPPYIINNFNMPFARLLGLRIGSTLFENLKQDLMVTSEAQIFPVQDFSLSYLAKYNFWGLAEIGSGISWAHLFSVDDRLTSPSYPDDVDRDRFPDATALNSIKYVNADGDTDLYSFKGVKPMVMVSIDPKAFLPSDIKDLFGKEDGCIYSEVCVIGWENFKNYDTTSRYPDYSDRMDRTPIMVGTIIPTFKVLDVLSLEFEHFTDKYPNSYQNVMNENLPAYFPDPSKNVDPWRCSLYARKTFRDKVVIIGQVARDHMRPSFPNYVQAERADVLPRHGDWWWVLRATLKF